MTTTNAMTRLRMLRVIDVMNRNVVKVNAQQSMTEIAKEFFDHDISAAPVVDELDHCVGILSATDFLRRDSHADEALFGRTQRAGVKHLTGVANAHVAGEVEDIASEYMTRTVRTVFSHTSLLSAAMLMNAEHIHRLPVVDENSHVVGMISTMDVVAALVNSMDEMDSILH